MKKMKTGDKKAETNFLEKFLEQTAPGKDDLMTRFWHVVADFEAMEASCEFKCASRECRARMVADRRAEIRVLMNELGWGPF